MTDLPPGLSLIPPSEPSYYYNSLKEGDVDVVNYQIRITRMIEAYEQGKTLYVKFGDSRRRGSVGKITSIHFTPVVQASTSYYGRKYRHWNISGIEVQWDGRSNKVSPYPDDIQWLDSWDQGTVWAYEKGESKKLTIPKVYDRLGEEIQVGNFVSFVYQKYGSVELMYGTVTRINHNGTVWAKNMKLSSDDTSEEHRIRDNANVVIMEKNFMDKLMMFKLSLA